MAADEGVLAPPNANKEIDAPQSTSGSESLVQHEKARRRGIVGDILMTDKVDTENANLVVLACAFATGCLDATTFNAFSTFVSMQTGNTVFLGLGAAHQETRPFEWLRALVAVGFFMLGSFVFSRLSRSLGPVQRRTLMASFFLQTLCIFLSAALVQGRAIAGPVPFNSPGANDLEFPQLAAIALLSFQAAGQIVGARALGVAEVPTVVITSLLCDLFSDPELFVWRVRGLKKRNNRAIGFTVTLVGAIVGGFVSKATHSVSASLWIVGGIKMVITLSWIAWKKAAGELPK